MEKIKTPLKIYFIQEHIQAEYFNGSICNTDIEKILQQQGGTPIFFPYHFNVSFRAKIARVLYLVRQWFGIKRGSVVVFQHPMYAGMNKLLIRLLKYRSSIKIVCITAEINGLKYDDNKILEAEKIYFQRFPYFIVHNPRMKAWLDKEVPGRTVAMLRFFDYFATPFKGTRSLAHTVAYAGNLEESGFLEKLPALAAATPKLTFYLYGKPEPSTTTLSDKVVYKGVVQPYQLPEVIEGSFGLVWDGDEVDKIAGHFGHYMEYISHHKVSLYILSGMPLIIYENAGTAAFVKEYGIGFTIRDLTEIEAKIDQLTAEEYRRMCDNTRTLAAGIAEGACLTGALETMMKKISS